MAERIPYFRRHQPPRIASGYERRPQRQADKDFYCSRPWRRVRDLKLRMNPLCESPDCTEVATHVHHVEPRKARPDLAYDLDNLQALCQPCHNRQEVR